jgi:hypothetical protein
LTTSLNEGTCWVRGPEDKRAVHDKWLSIIGRLRGDVEENKRMVAALSTTGAQNLTMDRIKETLKNVNDYLASGTQATATFDEEDDEEEDDDSTE